MDPESVESAPLLVRREAYERDRRARIKGSGIPTFWVRCGGCGAMVVTDEAHFPGECHDGWRMPADCEVTMVEQIMEE